MDKNTEESISIRAFAKKCQVSHVAILQAIKDGKIIEGVTKDKKIISSVAIKEAQDWGLMRKIATERDVERLILEYFSDVASVGIYIALDNRDLTTELLSMANDPEMFFEAMDDRLADYLEDRRQKLISRVS